MGACCAKGRNDPKKDILDKNKKPDPKAKAKAGTKPSPAAAKKPAGKATPAPAAKGKTTPGQGILKPDPKASKT